MVSIREGSSLYYSLLWTKEPVRQRFVNRLGLIQALGTTLEDVQEPHVAEQKIHWWHEEIQRLLSGDARHPQLKLCQKELTAVPAAQAPCLAVLSAASTQRFTPPATEAEADEQNIKSFTARLALVTHALSDSTEDLDPKSQSESMGLALSKYEQLLRLPSLIHRGLAVFSEQTYAQSGLKAADLAAHIRVSESSVNTKDSEDATPSPSLNNIPIVVENTAIQLFLKQAIDDAHTQLNQCLRDSAISNRYRKKPYLPLWRLIVLREKQLALWHRKQPDLLREKTTLTPISKLYVAWRHKR
ncbi:MAG: squalene/phytoene synthase family protein [Granulosicoccus sp.]